MSSAAAVLYLHCHSGEVDGELADIVAVQSNSIIPRRPTVEELALPPVPEDLHCPLCKQILRNATSAIPCGDVYCRECIEAHLKTEDPECVLCKEPLERGSMPRCRATQKLLATLPVVCENGLSYDRARQRFTSTGWRREGCAAVLPYGEYEAHLETCVHALVPCGYASDGCQLVTERGSLAAHQANCEFKEETCKCGERVRESERESHAASCPVMDMRCRHAHFGCEVVGTAEQLQQHLKECPYEAVKMALYKPIAQKALEDCLAEAMSKLEKVRIDPADPADFAKWQRHAEQMQEEAVAALEAQTKNVPQELRETVKKKLIAGLEGSTISMGSTTPPRAKSKSPNDRSPNHSSAGSTASRRSDASLEQATFSLKQVTEATDGFSDKHLLGKGGFGSVYRGMLYGIPVAIKRLHEGGNPEEFEFEVDILRRIRHPHIVLLMGCSPEANCIVSEFLSGGSLDDRLNGASSFPPLTWVDRLRISSEMASALLYMHKMRILHRDLKPANVLLDHNNVTKIADMGLARLSEGTMTMVSDVKGTIGYLDPYQLQTGELTRASDIYALGLIVLQLLTGQRRVQTIHSILGECGPATPTRDLERATGVFLTRLDPSAGQWSLEHAGAVLQLAIRCVERDRESRPELETEIQPELYQIAEAARTGKLLEQKPSISRTETEKLTRGKGWLPKGFGKPAVGGRPGVPLTYDAVPGGTAGPNPFGPQLGNKAMPGGMAEPPVGACNPNPSPNLDERRWVPPAPQDLPPTLSVAAREVEEVRLRDGLGGLTRTQSEASPRTKSGLAQEAGELYRSQSDAGVMKGTQHSVEEGRALKEEGNARYKTLQFAEAYKLYDDALSFFPQGHEDRAILHGNRAACLLEMRPLRFEAVVRECSKALEIQPHHLKCLFRRARANDALGNVEAAFEDLDLLLKLEPTNEDAQILHKKVKTAKNKTTPAPTSPPPSWNPLPSYPPPHYPPPPPPPPPPSQPQFPSPPSFFAYPRPPTHPSQPPVHGTQTSFNGGTLPRATETATSASPQTSTTSSQGQGSWTSMLASTGQMLLQQVDMFTRPKTEAEKLRAMVEEARDIREVGNKQFQRGEYEAAYKKYKDALNLLPMGHPDRATLHSNRAACLAESRPPRYLEAVKECDLALAVQPTFVRALTRRARAYVALENWPLAEADVNSLLRLDPSHADALEMKQIIQAKHPGVTTTHSTPAVGSSPPVSGSFPMYNMGHTLYGTPHSGAFVADMGGVHFGHSCDGCSTTPICGSRYVSIKRNSYELCRMCFISRGSPAGQYTAVPAPEDSNAAFLQSLGYLGGVCTITTQQQAVHLAQLAHQRGNAAAQAQLGLAYLRGKGVQRNLEEAIRHFNLAVAQQHPLGQYFLAQCFASGVGVPLNLKTAADLYSLAANQDLSVAQMELGLCYLEGKGMFQNDMEAVRWLQKAADRGHRVAQRKLAMCFSEGRGVRQDYLAANRWFQMAEQAD